MSGGGKGGQSVTVGYRYYAGMHLALCHGPVDSLNKIVVGERTAWAGSLTSSGQVAINQPNLFGGDEREGGIVGLVDLVMGSSADGQNDYLASKLGTQSGGVIPAFRGVVSLVLRQPQLSAMNPYLKPWSAELTRILRRSDGSPQWYSDKANIAGDMNPAHIIYECLTDRTWGRGYSSAEIDDASFRAAADTLYAENFGLSILWDQQQDIEAFIERILQHIDASIYVSPRTGLFTLKLTRDDYDSATLLELNQTNVIQLESFERTLPEELINQVTLSYHDRTTDKSVSISVQDIAGIERSLGEIKDAKVSYEGVTNGALAARLAMRDLRQLSSSLAKITLVANRTAASLNIGDVFRFSWPELRILRMAQISYGTLADGRVRITCVEDVFGLPEAVYLAPAESGWVDPRQAPIAANFVSVSELPYWTIVHEMTGESAAALAEIDPNGGFLSVSAVRPSNAAINYAVLTRQGSAAFEKIGAGDFIPSCVLANDIGQTDTVLNVLYGVDLDLVTLNTYAQVGNELVAVKAVDLAAGTVTVDRGVLDTVPAKHSAGARLYFVEGGQFYNTTQYLSGETVQAKVLPATGMGVLAESSAPTISYTFAKRQIRPYPPGKFRVNNLDYSLSYITGEVTVSWAHRSRVLQTAYLVTQGESNIGPEPGTTYTVRIYGEAGTLKHTQPGLTGTSWTYPMATEIAEGGLNRPNEKLTVKVEAVRDGFTSWQAQQIEIPECRGYGMFYGASYGE